MTQKKKVPAFTGQTAHLCYEQGELAGMGSADKLVLLKTFTGIHSNSMTLRKDSGVA